MTKDGLFGPDTTAILALSLLGLALAIKAEIRVDLILTLPMMTLLGALGWRIHATEP